MARMTYHAIYERSDDGTIWGYSPDLPGAAGAGDTLDQARESLREGIGLWLRTAKGRGDVFPPPSSIVSVESIAIDS